MKVTLADAIKENRVDRLIVHSIEQSLYQAAVEVSGQEHMLCDEQGQLLKANALLDMLKLCQAVQTPVRVLRQQSAYDEMIGCDEKGDTLLEIPLVDKGLY